jgi:glyoxylate reductase
MSFAPRARNILFCLLPDRVDADVIAASPATCDRIDEDHAIRYDVVPHCASCIPVTVIPDRDRGDRRPAGLLLALARRVVEGDRLLRSGVFPGGQSMHLEGAFVWGKTIGLVGGGGRIGRAVARRAHGFSMRILYWGPRRISESEERELGLDYVMLDRLLAESDFVSIHAPLKPETHHLIGARELALMKPTAFIVNTARGPIIDEEALVRADWSAYRRRGARCLRARTACRGRVADHAQRRADAPPWKRSRRAAGSNGRRGRG